MPDQADQGRASPNRTDEVAAAGPAPAGPDAANDRDDGERKGARGRDAGAALRMVYQKAVEEQVPPDLLDLLGRLH